MFIQILPLLKNFQEIGPVLLTPKASSQLLVKWQKGKPFSTIKKKKKYSVKSSGRFNMGSNSCDYFYPCWIENQRDLCHYYICFQSSFLKFKTSGLYFIGKAI